jgi:aryl-alcohol dehydrogenase-like predicted oxidoreductase
MKLGLGTVQFGLDYGVSNRAGRVPAPLIEEILRYAADKIEYIDTAPSYGESESVLGSLLGKTNTFRLITKTTAISPNSIREKEVDRVLKSFHRSLRRLNRTSVYGLLVHEPDDLVSKNSQLLWRALEGLKQAGFVSKLGVSVYTMDQLERIRDSCGVDIVQVPLNVFDQRLLDGRQIRKLKADGLEIHVRSVFLQGLLLMQPEELPAYFDRMRGKMREYHKFLRANNLKPLQAALLFVSQVREVDCAILGVCSKKQLMEVLDSLRGNFPKVDFCPFSMNAEPLVDPTAWKL